MRSLWTKGFESKTEQEKIQTIVDDVNFQCKWEWRGVQNE